MGAGLLALVRLQRRRDITREFWNWLWKSRFGAWAQKLRQRLEQLTDALGDVRDTGQPANDAVRTRHDRIVMDLRAERDLVQQRLADAVGALETIRLNLLRLHAGTGSVERSTTDLGLARGRDQGNWSDVGCRGGDRERATLTEREPAPDPSGY